MSRNLLPACHMSSCNVSSQSRIDCLVLKDTPDNIKGELNFVNSCRVYFRSFTVTPVRYEVEFEVNLRPTVSRPVCLGVRHPSGTSDQFFFLLEIFFRQLRVCYFVAPSVTRGRVCNLSYNCFWALPEQSLLGRSPEELTAIF
jgi:hypothetical protein